MKLPHLCTLVLLATPVPALSAIVWDAARDLRTNELSNAVQELTNPNAAVPAWSYGHRSTVASLSLSLFSGASDHTNLYGGSPNVQGWTLGGSAPALGVNVSDQPVIFNFGFGPLVPLNPGEISMHPQVGDMVVVRWTAPATDTYTINASWEDQDLNGGSGAAGYVVINGAVAASGAWANGVGNGFTDSNRTVALQTGDVVDFVLDANGDFTFDTTKFNATVVPEPATAATLGLTAGLLAFRRRRSTANS